MSDPTDFTVKVRGDRDLIISKPVEGFEVTYRREVYCPMLIASDVLRNDFDESKVKLLIEAWLRLKPRQRQSQKAFRGPTLRLSDFYLFDQIKPRIRCKASSIRLPRRRPLYEIRARLLRWHCLIGPNARARSGTEVNRNEQWLCPVQNVVHGGKCQRCIGGDDQWSGGDCRQVRGGSVRFACRI